MHFDHFAGNYKNLLDRSLAITGETSEYFADYKARYIARTVGTQFSGKVLDFGCGIGMLSRFIRAYLPASGLDGYDVSTASVAMVDRALATQGVFTSNLEGLARDYGIVVLANVLHHVVIQARLEVILETVDRLAPRGRLMLFEHNPANPLTRWVVNQCAFDNDAVLLWPSEASEYLVRAKLRLVRRDYIVFLPRMFSWFRRFEPAFSWVPLGAQYVLVGEKGG
jgi:2-polyprenyl-3-methyl-5-hydroxy-6-metoxy-1,4-benzoquinol methylase